MIDTMGLNHIFVVSLGNPAPYASTLHSAGHIVLSALQKSGLLDQQPSFAPHKFGKKNVPASVSRTHTLLQSPTLMNVSGKWVSQAWKDHATPARDGLVVIADDLEEKIGTVKIREWASSARGHNGIKDCHKYLKKPQNMRFARISIGIGRPEGRDHGTVSDYVLGPMPAGAKDFLEHKAPMMVLEKLKELEKKWGGFDAEEETTSESE
jgi:peptidyl-tRNA hydrolase, PTH1 family